MGKVSHVAGTVQGIGFEPEINWVFGVGLRSPEDNQKNVSSGNDLKGLGAAYRVAELLFDERREVLQSEFR